MCYAARLRSAISTISSAALVIAVTLRCSVSSNCRNRSVSSSGFGGCGCLTPTGRLRATITLSMLCVQVLAVRLPHVTPPVDSVGLPVGDGPRDSPDRLCWCLVDRGREDAPCARMRSPRPLQPRSGMPRARYFGCIVPCRQVSYRSRLPSRTRLRAERRINLWPHRNAQQM